MKVIRLHYQKIYSFDLANGEGIRASLFVSGCNMHCDGCFNKEAWDFCSGKEFKSEQYFNILNTLKDPLYDGLSILGGEPFDQNEEDINTLINLCKSVRILGKNVWIWSGHTFEELTRNSKKKELLENCDVLVDGHFILSKRDISLAWRGSSNQRIIDVQQTLTEGKIIQCDEI